MKNYGLAALTGVWLDDGIPRIMAPPHYFIAQVRAFVTAIPGEIAARLLAIIGGVFAHFAS